MMSFRSAFAATMLAASVLTAPQVSAQVESAEAPAPMPPLFASEFDMSRDLVDGIIADGIIVPLPKDPGGGYTHEQHKLNFRAMYLAGDLFRITGDQKYRDFVRDMLLEYAAMYPTLGEHPAKSNQNVGRLFWQVLNDAMWLVHSIQAYDSIRDTLTNEQRDLIDNQLFRKAAHFMSVDSKRTFNLIHNHATWATAGVGMTGYVLGDQHLVDIALKGSDKTGKTGFLRQTELLFSPDGYYAEGPYYQRFALLPFMVFANSINKNEPERKIFEHRDGILLKALRTTIELSYAGQFFPFNDALKEKGLKTAELYEGIAVAYAETRDPGLLSIAEWQGRTVLSEGGQLVAADLAAGKAKLFPFKSMLLRDGPEGKQGAVAIMRTASEDGESMNGQALITKNSSQGMGHGHFDKLSWQFYDNGYEVVTDYGAARFLNIEAKAGGRYLPENESWAKQTIAHNTLVVDEKSNFDGDVKLASAHAPTQKAYVQKESLQLSTGSIDSAFPGVAMTRSVGLVEMPGLEHPVVIDLLRASSEAKHQYDLPIHYKGHIMRVGFELESFTDQRPVLGDSNGYQHIWVDAHGKPAESSDAFVTWMLDDRFYTARWVPQSGSQMIFAQIGANDPQFNLRRESILIQRVEAGSDSSFVTVLEPHGKFDGSAERTTRSDSLISSVSHDRVDGNDIVTIILKDGTSRTLAISHNAEEAAAHSVTVDGKDYSWTGFAAVLD